MISRQYENSKISGQGIFEFFAYLTKVGVVVVEVVDVVVVVVGTVVAGSVVVDDIVEITLLC